MYCFVGKKGKCYDLDSLKKVAMKLNYNCPDDYKNGEGEGSCKGYKPGSKAPDNKKTVPAKTSTKRLSSSTSRIMSSEETISDLTKSNDKLLLTIKNSKDQEEIKKLQRIVDGNNKSIEYFKNKIKTPDTAKVNDVAKKVRSGKKITKDEYNVLKPLVEKNSKNTTSKSTNKKQAKPSKEDTNRIDNLIPTENEYVDDKKATEFYKQTMTDLSEYVAKTSDFTSDYYNQLQANQKKSLQVYDDVKAGKKVSIKEITPSNNDTKSKILENLITNAKDSTSFIGRFAIEELRKDGLGIDGKPYVGLSKEETNEYNEGKSSLITEIRSGNSLSTKPDEDELETEYAKGIFALYHKQNLLYENSSINEIPESGLKLKLNTYKYIDENKKTFQVSFEPGMEEEAKKTAFILSTIPNELRKSDHIFITNKSSPDDDKLSKKYGRSFTSAACFQPNSRTVVNWNTKLYGVKTDTLYHEFAHSADIIFSGKFLISNNKDYINAFESDNKKFTTKYAEDSYAAFDKNRKLAEDFAESVSGYLTDNKRFSKSFPSKAKFLKTIIGEPQ